MHDDNIFVCGKIPAIRQYYNVADIKRAIPVRMLRHKFFGSLLMKFRIYDFVRNYKKFTDECRFCRISKSKFPAAEQMTKSEVNALKNE